METQSIAFDTFGSDAFERMLSAADRSTLKGLVSPAAVQGFLDSIPYSTADFYRCPLRVLQERTAHCFDGAVFAAAALRRIGYPPLILDMLSNGRDDEHLLAIFKVHGHWGAVAKSNFVGLRYREPVYRTLRELVMSYFEQYYNLEREKTLRGYTGPLNLKRFDRLDWTISDSAMDLIAQRTEEIRRVTLIDAAMESRLSPVDERSYQSGLIGSDPDGLFKPKP
ncbi:MAG TPA: hypothetical protein VN300_03315 [Desulfobacterales bacterium]|nr:hypothetical protein [Desulfobacterales bacterium]